MPSLHATLAPGLLSYCCWPHPSRLHQDHMHPALRRVLLLIAIYEVSNHCTCVYQFGNHCAHVPDLEPTSLSCLNHFGVAGGLH